MAAAREDGAPVPMDLDNERPSSPAMPDQQPSPAVVNGTQEAHEGQRNPTPPPHRSPPPQTDPGEAFKLAGNKFYKAGDYERAIQEYNKGESNRCRPLVAVANG